MSEETLCYAIASGEYSDKSVHCIFEREDDARTYLRASGYALDKTLQRYDDPWYKPDGGTWERVRIEEYQFWPAGVVPHVDA